MKKTNLPKKSNELKKITPIMARFAFEKFMLKNKKIIDKLAKM